MFGNERYEEGRQQGKFNAFIERVKDKLISISEASKRLGVSEKEVARLAKV